MLQQLARVGVLGDILERIIELEVIAPSELLGKVSALCRDTQRVVLNRTRFSLLTQAAYLCRGSFETTGVVWYEHSIEQACRSTLSERQISSEWEHWKRQRPRCALYPGITPFHGAPRVLDWACRFCWSSMPRIHCSLGGCRRYHSCQQCGGCDDKPSDLTHWALTAHREPRQRKKPRNMY